MAMRLATLAEMVGGRLTGRGDLEITAAATLRDALPSEITLADNPIYLDQLPHTSAAAVVVGSNIKPASHISFISVEDPKAAFRAIAEALRPPRSRGTSGISPAAYISPTAWIASNVTIGPGCVIGDDVRIERGCRLYPNVTIMEGCILAANCTLFPSVILYENTQLGERVILHASVVLGAHGFGYENVNGRHVPSSQLGNVVIGSDVEIGAGTTIDRGSFGATTIGEGTKIDNQVMIGHNCRIGRHNLICAQVGIAGSCTTGDYVVMAGQVGLRDHVTLAEGVTIGAQSGVTESLTAPGRYLGTPAAPLRQEIQCMMARQKLPEMRKALRRLQQLCANHLGMPDAAVDSTGTANAESGVEAA